MVANFLAGGAVVNAFAARLAAEVVVVDVGRRRAAGPGARRCSTARSGAGTADLADRAGDDPRRGAPRGRGRHRGGRPRWPPLAGCLVTGDMGIANTTASAALVCAFTGAAPAAATGRGTGIDDPTLARKVDVVTRAVARVPGRPATPRRPWPRWPRSAGSSTRRSPASCSARRRPGRRCCWTASSPGSAALVAAALCPDRAGARRSPGTPPPSRGTPWRSAPWACARCWAWTCASARAPARCWRCRWCERRPGAARRGHVRLGRRDREGLMPETPVHPALRRRLPRRPAAARPPRRRRRRRSGGPPPGGRAAGGAGRGHRRQPGGDPGAGGAGRARLGHLAAPAATSPATSPAPGTRWPPPTTREVNAAVAGGGRARAHLLRPRRRPRRLQRLDAGRRPARRPRGGRARRRRPAARGRRARRRRRRADRRQHPRPRRAARVAGRPAGSVVLVGGGPGDPGLITVRGQQAVGAGRRRRRRPPRAAVAARRAAARGRGHRRLEAAARPVHGAGADQRAAGRARAGRPAGGAAQGRRPVRLRPRHGGGRRPAWPRACRSRWSPASPARSPCRRWPASR